MGNNTKNINVKELAGFVSDIMKRNTDVDTAIEDFLVKMGAFFDVDIIVVKEKSENGAAIKCTYEWSRKALLQMQGLERRFLDLAWEEWETRYLQGGGVFKYYKGDASPIALMHRQETVSLVQVPIYDEEDFVGCVDFVDSENRREWTEEEISAFKYICGYMYEEMFKKRTPKRVAQTLKKKLDRDSLTRLPKRDKFVKLVSETIEKDKDSRYVIISSDIANFKYINEKYGFNTGDMLLKRFTATIYLRIKGIVSCCREYSDIFLIAVKTGKGVGNKEIKQLVDDCNKAFLDEIRSITEDTNVAINSGFAFVGDYDITVEEAITGATAARKAAKDMALFNTSRCCAYESSMIANKARTVELIASCDRALENNEFQVYLQPKVLCRSYVMVGAEALIRWKKPDGSFVFPDEFIPAFESNGCIRKTDYFVYESVFKYLKERLDKGLFCVPISMNVSRVHLFNNNFVEFIDGLLNKYQVPTNLIEFELTESICLEGLPAVSYTMSWLRQKNIKISIDDFGSGYSSLEVLTRLPINVLKLDKVFMKDFLNDNEKIIIASIVEMANQLGLEVICEGVEEDKQTLFLMEAACEMLQGYVFSKPVPMDEFSEKLEREARDRACVNGDGSF